VTAAPIAALGAGLLCASPLGLLLSLRYLRARGALDARARKSYLAKALSLASAEVVAASLVARAGGRLALPALWALALAAASVVLLSRSLRGGGRRRQGRE